MPTYEYICEKCGEKFTVVMKISEHDKKRIRCPKCDNAEVAKQLQPFFAKTSRKT